MKSSSPPVFLQPPAFDINAVDAVNYGAIGVVIGHEISHGFDDEGAQFDYLGRLQNWWTDADLKHFQARGACVADQFDHYFIEPGIHHNGKLVLGESIGDLGGAKDRLPRLSEIARRQTAPRRHRRLHPRAAVLHRGASSAGEHPPRSTRDGPRRPASDREVPRDRPAVEPAGIPEGVAVQSRCGNGPPPADKHCDVW